MSRPFKKGHVANQTAHSAGKGHTVIFEWFRRFKAAVGTCAVRDKWNPSDMRIRLLFVMPNTSGWEVLIGNDSWDAGLGWLVYCEQSPRALAFRNAGGSDVVRSHALTPGTLYEAVIERIGDDHSIHVTGVTNQATFPAAHSAPPELYFGCRHTNDGSGRADFFNDTLVLAELTDLNDSSNCGRYSKFCRHDGIVPNDLAVLGAELVDMSIAVAASSSNFAVVNGRITCERYNTWGQRQAYVPLTLVPGKTYLITADLVHANRITVFFPTAESETPDGWISNSYYGCYKETGDGHVEALISIPPDADTSDAHIGIASVSYEYNGLPIEALLSVREADGFGQLNNPAEGSEQRYTKARQAWVNRCWPNLFLYSEQFVTPWSVVRGVVESAAGGYRLRSTDSAETYLQQSVDLDADTVTLIAKVKADSASHCHLLVWDGTGSGARAWFDLNLGSGGSLASFGNGWDVLHSTINTDGDWYICTATFSVVGPVAIGRISPSDGDGITDSAIDQSIVIERIQINEGSATAYRKTEARAGHKIPIAIGVM